MNSKPIDELTIDDLKDYKIWQWALDEEENEHQDETWVTPAATDNFTSDLKGSIVLGTLYIHANQTMPIMCSLDVTTHEVSIDSVIVYKKEGDAVFQQMIDYGHFNHYQEDIAFIRKYGKDWL
ncbi:hypothetical protein M3568_14280 [Priestia flexa]|uniref:hypothetical protein n=1 Tax=Priestia flexa TaxID=86664 RepID=UPI00203C28A6|nr:hypothetical protein [Priestia flexa]MCM3067554.1 hypothetical protein [Priestia flexa]